MVIGKSGIPLFSSVLFGSPFLRLIYEPPHRKHKKKKGKHYPA
jgi:hypothetical protein